MLVKIEYPQSLRKFKVALADQDGHLGKTLSHPAGWS